MKNDSKRLVIVDGVRTPFCRMGTDLAGCDAVELGRCAVSALLARTGLDPEIIDEVILGCVSQPFDAANLARVVALRAGIPERVPAFTVHRNCGSGLESLLLAADKAAAGRGEVFVVGGTESMSRVPLFYSAAAAAKFAALTRAKTLGGRAAAALTFRPRDFAPLIGLKLGLTDPVTGMNMGETAELLAREFGISREAQDRFALASHARALIAADSLKAEITPVYLPDAPASSPGCVTEDVGPRLGQSLEKLVGLKPVFDRRYGTVTAGNASQITDGAVALLVTTERRAERLGLEPLGRLVDGVVTGCDPARMGLGPAFAIERLAERTGLRPVDADTVEINEAFAAQVLAVLAKARRLGCEVPEDQLNPRGGAIALGHPVGATGGRLVLTALRELAQHGGRRALVSLCIGGGQGSAVWLEKID